MNFVGFVWVPGVNMEVNGIIVIDMRKRVLPMQEIIKQKVVLLLNDTFMYSPTWNLVDK